MQSPAFSLERTYDTNQRGEVQTRCLAGGDTELV
jgi:hypothetical protein